MSGLGYPDLIWDKLATDYPIKFLTQCITAAAAALLFSLAVAQASLFKAKKLLKSNSHE